MADQLDLVRKLVALSLFNPESKEAQAAFKKARALIVKNDIGQGDLFGTSKNSRAWDIEDFMRAGDKVRDVIAMAKDPEVQKTVAAGKELAMGVVSLFKRVKR